jgi:aspartate 1-decarboxylase
MAFLRLRISARIQSEAVDSKNLASHTTGTPLGPRLEIPYRPRQIFDTFCSSGSSGLSTSADFMKRTLLKSKIHRATVTDASLHYEGSVTIDPQLMAAADIVEWEQVDVLDINNGNRLTTYAISGEPGSGVICLNGAAARLVLIGDLVIICSYAQYSEEEQRKHVPKIVRVDKNNHMIAP